MIGVVGVDLFDFMSVVLLAFRVVQVHLFLDHSSVDLVCVACGVKWIAFLSLGNKTRHVKS